MTDKRKELNQLAKRLNKVFVETFHMGYKIEVTEIKECEYDIIVTNLIIKNKSNKVLLDFYYYGENICFKNVSYVVIAELMIDVENIDKYGWISFKGVKDRIMLHEFLLHRIWRD